MLDPQFPRDEQIRRFGFCWDDCKSFSPYHDFWSFAEAVVKAAPEGATIVEVGSYAGRSITCLAAFARESGKNLKLFAVDDGSHLGGNNLLKDNLKRAGVDGMVTVIDKPSIEAAKEFADNSCWLVFLDDDHRHPAVEAGVRTWMPKATHWLALHDIRWYTVSHPVNAMVGRFNWIYDERWQDIGIIPKMTLRENVDIYEQIDLPPMVLNAWRPEKSQSE